MNISEACYEAACNMSEFEAEQGFWACLALAQATSSDEFVDDYQRVMGARDCPNGYAALRSEDVYDAAEYIRWSVRDYRTFMLLMASEALK